MLSSLFPYLELTNAVTYSVHPCRRNCSGVCSELRRTSSRRHRYQYQHSTYYRNLLWMKIKKLPTISLGAPLFSNKRNSCLRTDKLWFEKGFRFFALHGTKSLINCKEDYLTNDASLCWRFMLSLFRGSF